MHAVLAEARRHVWSVDPTFWRSFEAVLAGDALEVSDEVLARLEPTRPSARRGERRANADEPAPRAVGLIPLHGLITPRPTLLSLLFGGGGGLEAFREQLREAVDNDDLDAIVLDVDSPGGSIALVEETAAEIRAAREVKPVHAVANVDAASAAYWLASQASSLSVTPSGMVGAIGTYSVHVDYTDQNDKLGVKPTYISAGKYKVERNPDAPLDDEAAGYMQTVVDDAYARFVRDVAAGRGTTERAVRNGYGEGRMLTSDDALAEGMVDRVETLEHTVERTLAGDEREVGVVRAAIPSDGTATLSSDEASDEARTARKSHSQVARESDEALAASVIGN